MPHYIRLCRFTPKGMQATSEPSQLFEQIRVSLEQNGCKIEQAFMVVGRYDFISIVSAKGDEDIEAADRKMREMGLYSAKTLKSFPIESFLEWADGEHGAFLTHWFQQAREGERNTKGRSIPPPKR